MLNRLRHWLFGRPSAPTAMFAPERPAKPPHEREQASDTPPPAAEPLPESSPSGLPFEIRPYRDGDAEALARVFREAIRVTAADHYHPDQLRAWSATADNPAFPADLAGGQTMVAEWQQETAGFAQLVDDRITFIYVHPDAARLGIATLLYHHLEDEARIQGQQRLVTEASQVAHDFFLFLGFQPEAEETVQRDGVALTRWRMHKPLT